MTNYQIIKSIDALRSVKTKMQGPVALIPTMGALHEGHLSLVKIASKYTSNIIVSIFVNPTQFNNPEDLAKYPRDIEADAALLAPLGVNYIFAPQDSEMYPNGHRTRVNVQEISADFEGPDRPGHFEGVATIVTKLFNLISPDFAIFGEKDFQQLCLVQALVADLMLNVKIISAPIIREPHGLAMSSRNERLSPDYRKRAGIIFKALSLAKEHSRIGMSVQEIFQIAKDQFKTENDLTISYLDLVDQRNLQKQDKVDEHSRILTAVLLQGVRLLDNIKL